MTERVPEFALLVGVFLGLSAVVSGVVLTGELFRSLLSGVVVCYPFAAFGVVRSDNPTEALSPRLVTVFGAVLGVVMLLVALFERPDDILSGVVASLVVALPPAAYATHFGADVNPLSPGQTLAVTAAVGATFLASAPLFGTLNAVVGLLVGLPGALYADARGLRLTHRQRRLSIVAGVLAGVAVAWLSIVMRLPLAPTTATAAALILAPSLFVAITREE
ncbi:hypothetical protein C440_07862 [Haloferax mucosum ATCC BAA-1512]|uniref:Uncharacterized protein n=1 Tax=Haloferax mucosum ATCC BAA-1512 TaxID=662479 RepID=M0IDX6_9EURY|nr:hypothetical protein [Haloferax mucosum]ELZ94975.1 hypothetical protein C440_07862 [Haloferax mucosum ATCC BAA-1512]